jgi:hypothetical protein
MASNVFNAAEIELRRQLLREELNSLEADKLKSLGGLQIIDFHHPERSPGWPIYNVNDPRNQWPQLLYHSTEKDPRNEERRLGIRRRNEANPHLAPMDVPDSEPLVVKVNNTKEREVAFAAGFVATPPERQKIDGNSPLELIGRQANNPLMDSLPAQSAAPAIDVVARVLELNAMNRDALMAHATELGVELKPEMTKAEMIAAIAYAPQTD